MRITTLFLAAVLIGASTLGPHAFAADKDAKDKDPGSGQYITVSPVAAPIVLNGRLINYIFVTLRLNLAPYVDAPKARDKEPYYRDAFVRAAHRKPFVKAGDYTHVDEARLKATMFAEATRIAGPGVITSVEILTQQPQKVLGLPKAEAPSGPRSPIP